MRPLEPTPRRTAEVARPTSTSTGSARGRRLAAPLLVTVWGLLAFESIGGLVIFCARLVFGSTPGETLHVVVGLALLAAYATYQWQHWTRVRPVRGRLDYVLGLFALGFMTVTLLTGVVLAWPWWQVRIVASSADAVTYPFWLSGVHNVASVMVLSFVAAHLGAVLMRDRRQRETLDQRSMRP